MKKLLLLMIMCALVLPAFADVVDESSMSFDWTITDGLNPVPGMNNYQVTHRYIYMGDYSDEEYLDTAQAGNPIDGDGFDYYSIPASIDINTDSTDWTNYIDTNISVSSMAAAAGIEGSLSSDAYAFFRPGYARSRAISGTGTTLMLSLPYNSEDGWYSNLPNWVFNLGVDITFDPTITGSYTEQEAISQFVVNTGYTIFGVGGNQWVQGPTLLSRVERSSVTSSLNSQYDFILYLNPYDEDFSFNIDVNSLNFVPTWARFDIEFSMGSSSVMYEENPGTPNDTGVVPEPATMFLLGSGLFGLAGVGLKRKRKSGF